MESFWTTSLTRKKQNMDTLSYSFIEIIDDHYSLKFLRKGLVRIHKTIAVPDKNENWVDWIRIQDLPLESWWYACDIWSLLLENQRTITLVKRKSSTFLVSYTSYTSQ